jgi:hypothetical protein
MAGTNTQGRCPHCNATLLGQPRACDQCGREIQPPARPASAERTTLSGMRLPPLPPADPPAGKRARVAERSGLRVIVAIVALTGVALLALAWWPY